MAVTILERPEGRILSTTPVTGSVGQSYSGGDATITKSAHGLSDGDYIYAVSNIEDYNGFWYVDSTGASTFKIKQYPTSDYVQFVQDAEITYYVSTAGHGWSAVHLPITYRLSSNLYPNNSSDLVRSIFSGTNSDGYTVLNHQSMSGVNTYDYVYLTTPNDDLSGSYQVLEWISSTVAIINLAYDSSNNFSGATVQKYYNNYNVIVRVYAGIRSGHEWASKKPYELASTLQLIPDSNGDVFFSVHEILKSYVKTENNTLLGTLPNNIDFWTNFYIEYAESYDDSDGYALGTYTSNFTSDQFNLEGYAVNSMLEFKNIYSGYLSDYLMNQSAAKFLTLFTIPVLFACSDDAPNCYNDISFIKPSSGDYVLSKQFYSRGVAGILTNETISGDEGIYRIPLEDASLIPPLSTFTNEVGTNMWSLGNSPSITVTTTTPAYLTAPINVVAGQSYTFEYTAGTSVTTGTQAINIRFLDNGFNPLGSNNNIFLTQTSQSGSISIIAPVGSTYIAVTAFRVTGGLTTITLYDLQIPISICSYDRVDISLGSEDMSPADFNSWPQQQGIGEVIWSSGYSILTFTGSPPLFVTSALKYKEIYGSGSIDVTVNWEHDVPMGAINSSSFTVYLLDEDFNTIASQEIDNGLGMSSGTNLLQFNISEPASYIGLDHSATSVFSGQSRLLIDQISVVFNSNTSETKQFKIDCGCSSEELRLTWLNNLGGFDYWNFTANKDLLTEIRETGQVTKPIFPSWPKSYGANADTIRKQTFRDSNKAYTVRSQYMTKDELEAVAYIKSSVLVQIINSRQDRRTVIVDSDSFRIYTDQDKLYSIAFNISFTNDIPSQTA